MSTVPTTDRHPPGSSFLASSFIFPLSAALLAAETVRTSALSDRVAQLYPDLPPLWQITFFAVPSLYLAYRLAVAAARGLRAGARRSPATVGAIPLVAVGAALLLFGAKAPPSSPARLPGAAAYYDIPGDASILEEHVTLKPPTRVAGGTTQFKVFKLRNMGVTDWVNRWLCRIDPAMNSRENLATPDCIPVPDTPAGKSVEVKTRVLVGNRDGTLVGCFKMSDGRGSWFYRDADPVCIELDVRQRVGG